MTNKYVLKYLVSKILIIITVFIHLHFNRSKQLVFHTVTPPFGAKWFVKIGREQTSPTL